MVRLLLFCSYVLLSGAATAQDWQEPARGTTTRAAMMDAVRPHAEWMLGSPVQFVVYELRQWGNLGFASLYPQRPGGAAIDIRSTPAAARGELDPDYDDIAIQALYVKSGQTWVAVHWAIGATDVWYAYGQICAVWRPVIPEACQGL